MFKPFGSRIRACGLLLSACACLGWSAAQAQPALTMAQALELAQTRSRQLPAQDAAALAARERAIAAGQLPDPVLKASLTNLPVDGPDRFSLTRDFMTMRSIGVMQEFTRSDKRVARSARYAREADVAEAARLQALMELRRATATAWLERHYLERVRDEQASLRREAALQIEAADAAYRGGRGSQADVFAARSAVARIDDEMLQTARQIETAQTRLARWVGAAADQPLAPAPSVDRLLLGLGDLAIRIEDHPRIVWLHQQQAAAAAQSDVARSNRRADWSVELMFSQRGPAYSNMVSVNLSVPLQWDQPQRQDRELAATLATEQQIREERDETLRELIASARAMVQEWQNNRERLALFDAQLLPLAAERTRAALAAYRGGAGPLAAVLDARRNEIDTRLDRIRLSMQTATLWASVEYMLPTPSDAVTKPEQKP
ncbi:MAG: TolC family protein [Rhodoferax sp.]|nr:TolC family protein [Rhodoferax sp.]